MSVMRCSKPSPCSLVHTKGLPTEPRINTLTLFSQRTCSRQVPTWFFSFAHTISYHRCLGHPSLLFSFPSEFFSTALCTAYRTREALLKGRQKKESWQAMKLKLCTFKSHGGGEVWLGDHPFSIFLCGTCFDLGRNSQFCPYHVRF